MTGAAKRKGDKFENDCAKFLTEHTKFRVARRFGAGQAEDEGDLYGIAGMTVQCADWRDKTAALREKPPTADQQAARIHESMIGVTALKMRGGEIRFVFTQEAFARLVNRYL